MPASSFLGLPEELRVMVYKLTVYEFTRKDHCNLMQAHPQVALELLAFLPQAPLSAPRFVVNDSVLENLVEAFELRPQTAELQAEIAEAAHSFDAYIGRYEKVEIIIAPSCQCIFKQPLAYRKGSVLDELDIEQDSSAHGLNLLVEDSALSFFENTGGQVKDASGWMGVGVKADVKIRIDWEMSPCAEGQDDCEGDWELENEDEVTPCAIRHFGCLDLEEKLESETEFMEKIAWALWKARQVKRAEAEAEKKGDTFLPEDADTTKDDDSTMGTSLPQKRHRNLS